MDVTISAEVLAGLIGNSPEEFSAALKKENSEDLRERFEIEDLIKKKFGEKLKSLQKAHYDKGHTAGKSDSLTALEKELSTKWGVKHEVGMDVEAIADAYVQNQVKAAGGNKLTPEAVKASDTYITDLKAAGSQLATLQKNFDDFKFGIESKQQDAIIRKSALAHLKEGKFALPEDETIRENQITAFINALKHERTFEFDGDDVKQILDQNKNPLRDNLANEISYKDHVLALGKNWFTISKDDGRETPGVITQTTPPPAGFTVPTVKSNEEYFAAMNKLQTLPEKQALAKAYDKQLKSGW